MALSKTDLAKAMWEAISQTQDKDGKELPPSKEIQEYASGLVDALKTAVVSFAPGTITGVTAPGSPLINGAGSAGTMVITPAAMIAKTGTAFPQSPKMAAENTALITYIGTGLLSFDAGSVTGNCTNTPSSPGPLLAGAASGGKINGLDGAACAAFVGGQIGGGGPEAVDQYTSIIDYLQQNIEVSFTVNLIVGTCPAGGGSLLLGAGTGGTIS